MSFKDKLATISPEYREKVRAAYRQKVQAEATLKELMAGTGYKNQTTALYRIMGLCPQCGKKPPQADSFYCVDCREYMSQKSAERNRRRMASALCVESTQPANHPYDNDNH